jgi:hypothetical protein
VGGLYPTVDPAVVRRKSRRFGTRPACTAPHSHRDQRVIHRRRKVKSSVVMARPADRTRANGNRRRESRRRDSPLVLMLLRTRVRCRSAPTWNPVALNPFYRDFPTCETTRSSPHNSQKLVTITPRSRKAREHVPGFLNIRLELGSASLHEFLIHCGYTPFCTSRRMA